MKRVLPRPEHANAPLYWVAALFSAFFLLLTVHPVPAADEAPEVLIRWQLPVVKKDKVLSLLDPEPEVKPVPPEDVREAPLILLVGIVSLPYLTEALIAAHRDIMLGGVVIDACDGELLIRSDQALPGEMVVVSCSDDLQIWRSRDPTSSELVATLLETQKQTPKKAK